MDQDARNIITEWFTVNIGGGLILPEGWFGRPFDNCHHLTHHVFRPHKTILELDHQLFLIFTDLTSISVEANEMILQDFTQFVFDWQEYGSLKPHASIYHEGIVKFVGAMPFSPLERAPIEFRIWSSADSPYDFGPFVQDYTAFFKTESESSKAIIFIKKNGAFDIRIQVSHCEAYLTMEPGGIQIIFEKGEITKDEARKFVEEICRNLEQVSPYRINFAEM